MPIPILPHVVLVVESALDDEALTLRALRKLGIPMRVELERAGDAAIARYLAEFVLSPPSLLVVSDGLLRVRAEQVVEALRGIHEKGTLAILHLLSSEAHVAAPGADGALVKPVGYGDYLEAVGSAARRMLLAREASA